MPRDPQGNYSLPSGTLVADGDTVMASQHNPPFQDVASALTNSLDRRGSGGMLSALSMNSHPITNVRAGVAPGDAVNVEQLKGAAPRPGDLKFSFNPAVPPGHLPCFGQYVLRAQYPELFDAIGTTFGTSAPDDFRIPDARLRAIVSVDGQGSDGQLSGRIDQSLLSGQPTSVGATGGTDRHTLTTAEMPSHNHTGTASNAGSHSHTVTAPSVGTGGSDIAGAKWTARSSTNYGPVGVTTGAAGGHSHNLSIGNTGDGDPHINLQPTITAYVFILAKVL